MGDAAFSGIKGGFHGRGGNLTLRKKLILAFTVLIVLLGSWIGYFSYQDAKNIVYANKKSEMADTINRIDIDINTWVLQIVRAG